MLRLWKIINSYGFKNSQFFVAPVQTHWHQIKNKQIFTQIYEFELKHEMNWLCTIFNGMSVKKDEHIITLI